MNTRVPGRETRCAAFLCLVLLGGTAAARADQAPNGGLQFNLSTPGARSLAMGGAFLGLADDATAAYTNPAGLTNLAVGGPEVAIEIRNWNYSSPSITAGHILGTPTQRGIDTVAAIQYTDESSQVSGLSFLSVGYILPKGFMAALYRHQIADFQDASSDSGVFVRDIEPSCLANGVCGRFFPSLSNANLQISNLGFSIAREIPLVWTRDPNDTLSIGMGASYFQLDYDSTTRYYDYFLPTTSRVDRETRGFYGPPDYQEDNLALTRQTQGDDDGFGGSLGLLWKGGGGHWGAGAVYRKGARFSTRRAFASVPETGGSLTLPDSYGLGVSYSAARGKTRVTLDLDRVLYSQRFHDRVDPSDPERQYFRLNDAGEVHLGLEQVILAIESRFVATVRLGGWSESAHNLEYRGPNPINRAFFPPGERENHWTAGLGLVFGESFQIDAAADIADPVNTVSISLVKFF